jgi:uncharacterized protein YkwD
MSHTGADGSSVGQRAQRQRYEWGSVGENVSAGYRSVNDALAGWMKSPGHCSNMMSAGFTEVAVAGAFVAGDTYGWYRAMVLGRPLRAPAASPPLALQVPAAGPAPAAAGTGSATPVQVGAAGAAFAPASAAGQFAGLAEIVNARRSAGATCRGRAVAPAAPLRWDARLESVAAARNAGERATSGELATRAGVPWRRIQEIAGSSAESPEQLVQRWSEEFCEALLSSEYSLIGLVAAGAAGAQRAWIMILAQE